MKFKIAVLFLIVLLCLTSGCSNTSQIAEQPAPVSSSESNKAPYQSKTAQATEKTEVEQPRSTEPKDEDRSTDPHLLSEWDYEKNSKWTPSNVSRNSMKVVWWKCGTGHSYRAKIADRTIEQKGCPQCEAEFQQALPQMLIMMYGAQNGITVKSNSDSELGMRLVAYLPELHCAVDIAGATVTEKREQSVKAHICQSNRLGYYLIKRTTDTSQMAAEIKTLFIRNHIYLHTDSEKDVQVLRERFLEWKNRNACKLNGKY